MRHTLRRRGTECSARQGKLLRSDWKARYLSNALLTRSVRHENTLKFIEGYLEQASDYWTFRRQPFTELYAQGSGTFSAGGTSYDLGVFTYSPSTAAEGVTAPIVAVASTGCDAADYSAEVSGSIALVARGVCPFSQKATLAQDAGAAGLVIYNNIEGTLAGTLGGAGDYAPTGGINLADGTAILEALPLDGTLQITSVVENRTTFNSKRIPQRDWLF